MNDKFRELAKQSGIQIYYDNDSEFEEFSNDIVSVLENYTELVIQECCSSLNPMLRDMISRGKAVDIIKQHFGVE